MRFIVMHKVGPRYETGTIEQREIAEMGAFIQQAVKDGVFTNGAGLVPKVPRSRIIFKDGVAAEVRHGVKGTNNLLEAFAMLKVANLDEAVSWSKRFGRFVRDGEIELGRVTELWDLGFAPKPEGPVPEHYLALFMATKATEEGLPPPSAEEQQAMGAFIDEMAQKGVLKFTEGILPSKHGARMTFKAGKRVTMVDGPFTESKELIAGFSILNVPSREAALAWAERYGSILMDLEVDVLKLHDEAAFDGTKKASVMNT